MFSAVALAFFLYSLAGLRKIRSKEGARREGFLFSSFFHKNKNTKIRRRRRRRRRNRRQKERKLRA
ncbi:hypothetical protein POPTR_002G181501v4 [Populus trichocarpa]|uniref:Uncharacterized protein n=1 Tax=Populus trichocarpa TaxID=3694 RepID=A0ACC0TEL2_POPTR|nr:hypothetical protein POPTR_002G181501v4 [Populus trichocarpa]